jgi:hypothetical protein
VVSFLTFTSRSPYFIVIKSIGKVRHKHPKVIKISILSKLNFPIFLFYFLTFNFPLTTKVERILKLNPSFEHDFSLIWKKINYEFILNFDRGYRVLLLGPPYPQKTTFNMVKPRWSICAQNKSWNGLDLKVFKMGGIIIFKTMF